MEDIVDKAMKDGAVGLSTGLIYIPGTYTKTPEIVSLAKIAAKYNGVYATHMRDEGDSVTDAIEEALTIGQSGKDPCRNITFQTKWPAKLGKKQRNSSDDRSSTQRRN